jgi:hypothetical protein
MRHLRRPRFAAKGFDAMMRGNGNIVTGWMSKLQSAIALLTPSDMLAEQHRKVAAPRTAGKR